MYQFRNYSIITVAIVVIFAASIFIVYRFSDRATDKHYYCTQEPMTTAIGRDVYPVKAEYSHLPFLGQVFTAVPCGSKRLESLWGVEDGNYTLGSHIRFTAEADITTISPIMISIGYECADTGLCLKWMLKDTVPVKELLKLEPYAEWIEFESCLFCG